MAFSQEDLAIMETIIKRYPRPRSAIMPLLHFVQSRAGYVTNEGIEIIAQQLDLAAAEVTAVSTFYTQYKPTPVGEYHVGVCTNTLCAIMGGDEIMGTSMESLIHHFKLVTEGFHVPAGQVYVAIESPRGELGAHVASDGGTKPYRMHFREPSFNNLQATSAMSEGGMVADIIGAVASIDPVMGGVDR